ncbi:MAG: hypothetical protein ACK58T_22375, partial [Phycisphaerae bacterium]
PMTKTSRRWIFMFAVFNLAFQNQDRHSSGARRFQNRDWLPTDAVFSCKICNCKGACPGFESTSEQFTVASGRITVVTGVTKVRQEHPK